MDETSACYGEEFKKAFTKEQREALIFGMIEYVPTDCIALLADIHGFGAYSLREGMMCYLKELMEREEK